MATLILTAVGTAVGGPIGGALGSILGQRIDQGLFAPKARQGPRLGDLAVQTSTYGVQLPKLFGRMRVAGTVIWATDLIESRSTSGSGKGQPKTVNYSYAANFAVALSARPIIGVRRIWADGKLLRGEAGDFKSATAFRLYRGDEDQPADPLIASAEGIGATPAHRGLAYAVFEDFQLADYGNRIPSLTFEVEADDGPVTIGAIAEALCAGGLVAGPSPLLHGYAASGDSLRGAIEMLAEIAALSLADDGVALRLQSADGPAQILAAAEESGRREMVRQAAGAAPGEIAITYYDPARDHQAGLQRASSGERAQHRSERHALPAALSAEAAKALAEARLAAVRAGRMRASSGYGWARANLRPGAIVGLEKEAGCWRVRRITFGPMTAKLELERQPRNMAVAGMADAGSGVAQPDLLHGPTALHLIDAPIGEPRDDRPLLFIAAAGPSPGWRRAALMASFDAGGSWLDIGATVAPATMGFAIGCLGVGQSSLIDEANAIEIELLNDAMWIEGASDGALIAGANLALVGDELIQFGRAVPLGGRRFRLSRLLRGRRGTEWAMAGHDASEPFVMIEAAALMPVEAPAGSAGMTMIVSASGVGDSTPANSSLPIGGESLRAPSPVHVRARRLPEGDVTIGWTRRSRRGWSWIDGTDAPLGEEAERYRLTITGAGFERIETTAEPAFVYDMAMQAADGAAGALSIAISQIGDHGLSRPADLVLD
ncbi:MAG: phage tail protein [Sphingomonas sp.]